MPRHPRSAMTRNNGDPSASEVIRELREKARPEKARVLSSFFKTGKGQYGEGDVFLGVSVPEQRKIAQRFRELPLREVSTLLMSNVHEHRLTGLLVLVERSRAGSAEEQAAIADFYLAHSERVNNWDLVDLSANHILGAHLLKRPRKMLYRLARSRLLWERRIAIIATFAFILSLIHI